MYMCLLKSSFTLHILSAPQLGKFKTEGESCPCGTWPHGTQPRSWCNVMHLKVSRERYSLLRPIITFVQYC